MNPRSDNINWVAANDAIADKGPWSELVIVMSMERIQNSPLAQYIVVLVRFHASFKTTNEQSNPTHE
jgi:hypothetical protein